MRADGRWVAGGRAGAAGGRDGRASRGVRPTRREASRRKSEEHVPSTTRMRAGARLWRRLTCTEVAKAPERRDGSHSSASNFPPSPSALSALTSSEVPAAQLCSAASSRAFAALPVPREAGAGGERRLRVERGAPSGAQERRGEERRGEERRGEERRGEARREERRGEARRGEGVWRRERGFKRRRLRTAGGCGAAPAPLEAPPPRERPSRCVTRPRTRWRAPAAPRPSRRRPRRRWKRR